ncbi:MAG: ATP-binding protein [bacterium]
MDKYPIVENKNIDSANTSLSREFLVSELRKAKERLKQEIEKRDKFEEELKKTKDFLQCVIDAIPIPLAVKDREHRWILINRIICDIFQKPREELLGKTDHDFILDEEADVFRKIELDVFNTGLPNINEEMFTEINGRKRWQIAQKEMFTDSDGSQYLLAVAYDITDRKIVEEELVQHHIHLNKLLKKREEERAALSRDLHDALGQKLTALSFEINNMTVKTRKDAAFGDSAKAIIKDLHEELRRIYNGLTPVALEKFGLSFAIEDMLIDFEKRSTINVSSNIEVLGANDIDSAKAICIYRIVQEILTNITKHSEATEVSVSLSREPNCFSLKVKDNGKGFDPNDVESNKMGLTGIQERAELFGGLIKIETTPGKGVEIYCRIPH